MRNAGARFAGLVLLDVTIDLKAECRSKAERLRLADATVFDSPRNSLVVQVPLHEPLPGCVTRVRNPWVIPAPPGGRPGPAERKAFRAIAQRVGVLRRRSLSARTKNQFRVGQPDQEGVGRQPPARLPLAGFGFPTRSRKS